MRRSCFFKNRAMNWSPRSNSDDWMPDIAIEALWRRFALDKDLRKFYRQSLTGNRKSDFETVRSYMVVLSF